MQRFRFQQRRNCWQVARAERLSVVVDGESYFSAVRSAMIAARRRIFILAWDIHSQLELVRDDPDPASSGTSSCRSIVRSSMSGPHTLVSSTYTVSPNPEGVMVFPHAWYTSPRVGCMSSGQVSVTAV